MKLSSYIIYTGLAKNTCTESFRRQAIWNVFNLYPEVAYPYLVVNYWISPRDIHHIIQHFNPQVSSPLGVQHSSTQSTPTKKKGEETEHITQKQIMKSERTRKEEKKEGLMNFKNKFEDSTQSRVS